MAQRPANKRHEKKNTTPFNIRYYATIRNWQRRRAQKKNNKNSFFHSKAKAKTEIQYVYSQNDPTLCVLVYSQHNSHLSHYGRRRSEAGDTVSVTIISRCGVQPLLFFFLLLCVGSSNVCVIFGAAYSYVAVAESIFRSGLHIQHPPYSSFAGINGGDENPFSSHPPFDQSHRYACLAECLASWNEWSGGRPTTTKRGGWKVTDVKPKMFCFTFIRVSPYNKFGWSPGPPFMLYFYYDKYSRYRYRLRLPTKQSKGSMTDTLPFIRSPHTSQPPPPSLFVSYSRYDVACLSLYGVVARRVEGEMDMAGRNVFRNNLNYSDIWATAKNRRERPAHSSRIKLTGEREKSSLVNGIML